MDKGELMFRAKLNQCLEPGRHRHLSDPASELKGKSLELVMGVAVPEVSPLGSCVL